MKIFWSWQSDLPSKVSRHFVRDALQDAIDALNEERDIAEPDRPEAALDHDRKGVPGSPDVANIILQKIRNSDVFVADVTPVGATSNTPPKKLMNPNVAIELGYALHTLGDQRLIMIMNTAFGGRPDLPFDLQHKAGPIFYDLSADASNDAINAARRQLMGNLTVALRAIAEAHAPQPEPFARVPHIPGDPSRYFEPDELVVDRQGVSTFGGATKLKVPKSPLVFLRVIPTKPRPMLSFREAEQAVRKAEVRPFGHDWGSRSVDINRWGAIAYESLRDEEKILHATQLHRNGELWGFDAYIPSPTHQPKAGGPPGIWAENLEQAFEKHLMPYVNLLETHLSVPPPYKIVAGLSGVKQHILALPGRWETLRWGPFLEDPVVFEYTLTSTDPVAIEKALLAIYNGIFEAVGKPRPEKFRGFPRLPKSTEGS